MKKILYYIPTFPVFTENFITREIEAIVETGKFEVSILALKKDDKVKLSEVLKNKTHYLNLGVLEKIYGFFYLFANPLKFLKLLVKYGRRAPSLGTAVLLSFEAKKFKSDLIVANWITEGALLANMISDIENIPFMISCHATDIWLGGTENIRKRINDSKSVITCTSNNKKYLDSIVGPKNQKKIFIVNHYLNENTFESKTSVFNDVPVFLAVGRMVEKKGFIYLIKASKILKDKNYTFKVKIAGNPDVETETLKKEIINLNLSGFVEILPKTTFPEIKDEFLNADALIAPSVKSATGDRDGIPNVIVEAGLAGIPVISTKVSAIPEVIEEGGNGFLVEERNEEQLALKMEKLIENKNLRVEMGRRNREVILNKFGKENTIDKLVELFES